MAKEFAARISKKERKTVDLADRLGKDVFKTSDDRLLKGARLAEVKLSDIDVKDQVRTKFNDDSIKELAKNIQVNGLIQPLVVHRNGSKYTLICGERRFRAMTSIKQEIAPCFILENKTEQELMAIQFSENSSREELHYIDKADGILNYQEATNASERKIQEALAISKSEVHRSLMIAKMSKDVKEAAKKFDIEKYVLVEFDAITDKKLKENVSKKIVEGEIKKRSDLARFIRHGGVVAAHRKQVASSSLPRNVTANAFLKAMDSMAKNLDPKTREMLKSVVENTKEIL